jgi:uncharacterized protein
MLITVETFRNRVDNDCKTLIADLQELTGRYGTEEAHAWESSLGKLSQIFKAPSFQPLHLYFGSRGNLALEYQLPASSSWCDVVLLGQHQSQPAVVILELKDWMTRGDRPGYWEGLIERQGRQELHPSDQVRGYAEYCRRFHSAVAENNANVYGCALFTRDVWLAPYTVEPNKALTEAYPAFTTSPRDVNQNFPKYFSTRLTEPSEPFAEAFAEGSYRQNRGFIAQIGAQILSPSTNVFELLDNQRRAFSLSWATVENAILEPENNTVPKKVLIIKGPPGSGKSVIAARLWATLVTDKRLPEGEVIFATTSMSQNSNWSHLFDATSQVEAASGVIRKATSFSPITTQRQGQLRKKHGDDFLSDASEWRGHLKTLRALGENFRDGTRDNQNLVTIVDEAHALINPEHPEGRGQFGFVTTLGPQAYHIIRSSLVTIFLLDPLQGFRQRENTTIADIQAWSKELGAENAEEISLEGNQFRCAGSVEFVSWIEGVLRGDDPASNRFLAKQWSRSSIVHGKSSRQEEARSVGLDFRVYDNPEAWEEELSARHSEGSSVRILSSYCREWKTEGAANPHSLPPSLMDFHEPYVISNQTRYWSRIWNFVPSNGSDYTWYVSGHPAGKIAADPLCEVGCPYAVRGFDYDYIGILWLNDLAWDGTKWKVNPFAVEESGVQALIRAARDEAKRNETGKATLDLLERVSQAYRIIFTRALKGVYVWAPDVLTRNYLLESINSRAH